MPASAWLCRYWDMTGTQGFTHQLQPLVRSQSQHVCFIQAVRWPEQNAHELTNCSYYICKKPKSWQYCLAKKVLCLTKVPSSQLFCPETLSKQFTLVGTKCLLNSQRVLAEALFPEKLCSSQPRFTAHCATTSLTLLFYLSTVPLFCTFYAVLLVSYKCA